MGVSPQNRYLLSSQKLHMQFWWNFTTTFITRDVPQSHMFLHWNVGMIFTFYLSWSHYSGCCRCNTYHRVFFWKTCNLFIFTIQESTFMKVFFSRSRFTHKIDNIQLSFMNVIVFKIKKNIPQYVILFHNNVFIFSSCVFHILLKFFFTIQRRTIVSPKIVSIYWI